MQNPQRHFNLFSSRLACYFLLMPGKMFRAPWRRCVCIKTEGNITNYEVKLTLKIATFSRGETLFLRKDALLDFLISTFSVEKQNQTVACTGGMLFYNAFL